MNLRETLSNRPRIGIGVAVALLLLCFALVAFQFQNRQQPSSGDAKAFFTTDDGKTWFADELTNIPPFDKDGKPAVRALLFKGPDGKPFVGYLQRFTPEAKKAIENLQKPNLDTKPDTTAIRMAYTVGREVKRPGDAKWVSGSDGPKSAKVIAIKTPNGDPAEAVSADQ